MYELHTVYFGKHVERGFSFAVCWFAFLGVFSGTVLSKSSNNCICKEV